MKGKIYIGCHLSVTDGYEAMGKTMLGFGGNTFAFFTRNPRGGKSKELLPEDTALTIGAALLYIHYTEFVSLKMDDYLKSQQNQLDTDVLTGVLSRYAYSQALRTYAAEGALPTGLAAFTVDINGLKRVNDRLGHEAGDELIHGAAECIVNVFGDGGQCYRTGGDEFVVLTTMDRSDADDALRRLEKETGRWRGEAVKSLNVAAGYALAAEHEGLTVEELVKKSDETMYEAKAAYYRNSGRDRRRRR